MNSQPPGLIYNPGGFLYSEPSIQRFLELQDQDLRKKPATGELLVWLRILALNYETVQNTVKGKKLSELPFVRALIKDHQDKADLVRKEKYEPLLIDISIKKLYSITVQ